MKMTLSNKKQKININVLPQKYRGTTIKFIHLVAVLGTFCAIAIVLLVYQIYLDAAVRTKALKTENDFLATRYRLRLIDQQEKLKMTQTITELEEIGSSKAALPTNLDTITAAADESNVELVQIDYQSKQILLSCSTEIYEGESYYVIANESLDSFESALIETPQFLAASHDGFGSDMPDIVLIRVTPNSST